LIQQTGARIVGGIGPKTGPSPKISAHYKNILTPETNKQQTSSYRYTVGWPSGLDLIWLLLFAAFINKLNENNLGSAKTRAVCMFFI